MNAPCFLIQLTRESKNRGTVNGFEMGEFLGFSKSAPEFFHPVPAVLAACLKRWKRSLK